MINPYDAAPMFSCSGRVLLERAAPPPMPTNTYQAMRPGSAGGSVWIEGVGRFRNDEATPLVPAERLELAEAMIHWWRAWGGVP